MFRVEWIQQALDDLMVLWMRADPEERRAITDASQILDQELEADPHKAGESRGDDERVVFVPPLGVVVEIDPERKVVWVIHAWRLRKRGES